MISFLNLDRVARIRSNRSHIRAQGHSLRQSASATYGRGLLVAGCKRDASISNPRSGDAAGRKAVRRAADA